MSKPPKCKLCGIEHWSSQPHAFEKPVTRNVTARNTVRNTVTPHVTDVPPVTPAVTYIPTEIELIHECPVCGLLHHRPLSNAERQAAYRQRRAGG